MSVLSRIDRPHPTVRGSVAVAVFAIVLLVFAGLSWARFSWWPNGISAVLDTAVAALYAAWFVMRVRRHIRDAQETSAYEAAKAKATRLSLCAAMEADLLRPVSEWIADAEAKAEREWVA